MLTTADGVEVDDDATVWGVLWHYTKAELFPRKLADINEADRKWVAAESYSTRAAAVQAEIDEEQQAHEARMARLRAMLETA